MKEWKDIKDLLKEAISKGTEIVEKFPGWDEMASFTENCIDLYEGFGRLEWTKENVEMVEGQAESIIKMYSEFI